VEKDPIANVRELHGQATAETDHLPRCGGKVREEGRKEVEEGDQVRHEDDLGNPHSGHQGEEVGPRPPPRRRPRSILPAFSCATLHLPGPSTRSHPWMSTCIAEKYPRDQRRSAGAGGRLSGLSRRCQAEAEVRVKGKEEGQGDETDVRGGDEGEVWHLAQQDDGVTGGRLPDPVQGRRGHVQAEGEHLLGNTKEDSAGKRSLYWHLEILHCPKLVAGTVLEAYGSVLDGTIEEKRQEQRGSSSGWLKSRL
jgi:hypothetical protein